MKFTVLNKVYCNTKIIVSKSGTHHIQTEVLALTDGFKDYDEVTVNVKQYEIIGIVPNPASGQVTINYDVAGVSSAYLIISKPYDPSTDTFVLDVLQNQTMFDVSNYEPGIYGVILVCDDQVVDQKLLLVQ
jgi:hypothetical protein